jgi:hypothetical protein
MRNSLGKVRNVAALSFRVRALYAGGGENTREFSARRRHGRRRRVKPP